MENRMTEERTAKFKRVVHQRQSNLTVILENVHDPHNIGAVLRTCDSVGIKEIFVLYSDPRMDQAFLELGQSSSSGARKWVDVHFYTNTKACFEHVKQKYDSIYSTHLSTDAVSMYDLDLTQSIALLFGNEKDGVSDEALTYSNGNFIIPQMGMVKSLNISVACAVTLYEALRQRDNKKMYTENPTSNAEAQDQLMKEYTQRHIDKLKRKKVQRINE